MRATPVHRAAQFAEEPFDARLLENKGILGCLIFLYGRLLGFSTQCASYFVFS